MRASVVLTGFWIFSACLVLHVLIWRWKLSRISSLLLIVLFLAVPAALGIALVVVYWGGHGFDAWSAGVLEVLLLHLALSLAYIASYPAVRAVSPSLEVMLYIWEAPGRRMTDDEITRQFTDRTLVKARVDDLIIYRFLEQRDGRFVLTPLSKTITLGFLLYRKLLGLPVGEG